jgi:membrane protein
VVESAVDHRFSLGLAGVAVAVYSGWNWMNALRDSLTGMWRMGRINESIVATVARDCLALLGLGLALLVVFGVTVAGSDLGMRVLGVTTPGNSVLSTIAVGVGSEIATVLADLLIFWWVLARLPRIRVSARSARCPALVTAVGFEILKHLVNVYLQALGRSPTGVTLGSIVGVLVFAYLVSRLMLLEAAWIATAGPLAATIEARRPGISNPTTPAAGRPAGPDVDESGGPPSHGPGRHGSGGTSAASRSGVSSRLG